LKNYVFGGNNNNPHCFSISAKTRSGENNNFYNWAMGKVKEICFRNKQFEPLNNRCIYNVNYDKEWIDDLDHFELYNFSTHTNLNIEKKITIELYKNTKVNISTSMFDDAYINPKALTKVKKMTIFHKDPLKLKDIETRLIEEYKKF
jgi:hypothetical protein